MTLPEKLPRKRGGIPKGVFCPGCGAVSSGIHLARELLPATPAPESK